MLYNIKNSYLCTVFFMVLDLRLTMKIGCRDDNLFFFRDIQLRNYTISTKRHSSQPYLHLQKSYLLKTFYSLEKGKIHTFKNIRDPYP